MEDKRDLNIVICCLDKDYGEMVAQELASKFDMYYLDSEALYEFDIQPYTISYVIKKFGMEQFRKNQSGTMKYVSTFSNTIITVESGALLYQNNIDMLTKDGLIVYLKKGVDKLYKTLLNKDYSSKEEYNFYCLNKREINFRDEVLVNISEVVVDCTYLKPSECANEVIEKIISYYGGSNE